MRGEHLFIFTLPDLDLDFDFVQTQQGNYVVAQRFVSSHFLLRVITEDVFDDFDASPLTNPCSVLPSLHFCMCTNWWCYRSAESDSTGTELQNTS